MADISSRSERIAVVGFGSSADYAVDALLDSGFPGTIDILDRLCTPYGRRTPATTPVTACATPVGVPPVFTHPAVRFFGNVMFGADLGLADLQRHYDATVFATGAPSADRLGLPGERLPGNWPAREFAAWCHGARTARVELPPRARHVAVTGSGAPALDIVATLVGDSGELARRALPDHVRAELGSDRLSDVYLLTRHGPAHAGFTAAELGRLGGMGGVDVLVSPEDLGSDRSTLQALEGEEAGEGVRLLRDWAGRGTTGMACRVHLLFWCSPTAVLGADRVAAVRAIRVPPRGRCEYRILPAQVMLPSEGVVSPTLPGLPMDARTGTVPHQAGRIVDRSGARLPSCYVTGRLKRGAQGASNVAAQRADAGETVRSVLADLHSNRRSWKPDPAALPRMLRCRDTSYFTTADWLRLAKPQSVHQG